MSILTNIIRIGNFSSSSAWKLMTNGKAAGTMGAPAKAYIQEKNFERKLGRSLSLDKYTKPALWGHFLEQRVHDLLPLGYELTSDITLSHETIDCWVGSPDNLNRLAKVVCDTKCFEPKALCEYVETLSLAQPDNNTELFKEEYPKEYWQLVSNACIMGYDLVEAIVYMPYFSEIEKIRAMAELYRISADSDNKSKSEVYRYHFIETAPVEELSYLMDDVGYYKNLNIFRFTVPQGDKDMLTERVNEAGKMLLPRRSPAVATPPPTAPFTTSPTSPL